MDITKANGLTFRAILKKHRKAREDPLLRIPSVVLTSKMAAVGVHSVSVESICIQFFWGIIV